MLAVERKKQKQTKHQNYYSLVPCNLPLLLWTSEIPDFLLGCKAWSISGISPISPIEFIPTHLHKQGKFVWRISAVLNLDTFISEKLFIQYQSKKIEQNSCFGSKLWLGKPQQWEAAVEHFLTMKLLLWLAECIGRNAGQFSAAISGTSVAWCLN